MKGVQIDPPPPPEKTIFNIREHWTEMDQYHNKIKIAVPKKVISEISSFKETTYKLQFFILFST